MPGTCLSTWKSLRTDKFGAAESFQDFLQWHHENKVDLWQLDPGENNAYLDSPEQPSELAGTDIGFWDGKYVLLFTPIRNEGERERTLLRIAYCGEPLYAAV